jgi:hypothetical protein
VTGTYAASPLSPHHLKEVAWPPGGGLRLLSLCSNGLGPGAATALGKLLSKNASLQRLVSSARGEAVGAGQGRMGRCTSHAPPSLHLPCTFHAPSQELRGNQGLGSEEQAGIALMAGIGAQAGSALSLTYLVRTLSRRAC